MKRRERVMVMGRVLLWLVDQREGRHGPRLWGGVWGPTGLALPSVPCSDEREEFVMRHVSFDLTLLETLLAQQEQQQVIQACKKGVWGWMV